MTSSRPRAVVKPDTCLPQDTSIQDR